MHAASKKGFTYSLIFITNKYFCSSFDFQNKLRSIKVKKNKNCDSLKTKAKHKK